MDSNKNPNLIEIGVKSFLNHTLKKCNDFKMKYFNTLYNFILFVFFILILTMILFFKYKGKITNDEKEMKDIEKKNYILSKIRNYQQNKLQQQQMLISGLPYY